MRCVSAAAYHQGVSTALYRRYRPDTFEDVIGQEHVTGPLQAALAAGKVTHAYLFSGPRGCGKTTSARIFARCLNCAKGPTPTPCGECESCRELATGGPGSLDVVEIDAASHNGVDDARELRERAVFAPARDRYKIFILDEAHMVTPQGFNALLKLVEEPPDHVKFIFATTEPDKVIGTIRSRTHHYPFRLVPPGILEDYLAKICHEEGIAVGAGVLPMVVRAGAGSVRDSLSVLDQLIAGASDGSLEYEGAAALLGYTSATLLDDAVGALAGHDGAALFSVVDRVVQSGHDPRRFVEDLLDRLRDLVVVAMAGDAADSVLSSAPGDQLARMHQQAQLMGAAGASRAADLTSTALTQMTGATSPRLQLELLCARLLLAGGQPHANATPAPQAASETAPPAVPEMTRPRPVGGESRPGPAPTPTAPAPTPAAPKSPAKSPDRATPATPTASASPALSHAAAAAAAARQAAAALRASAGTPPAPATPAPATPTPAAPTPTAAPGTPDPAPAAAAPTSAPASTAAPTTPSFASTAESAATAPVAADSNMVRQRWPEVLETLTHIRRASWVLVAQSATVGEISGGEMKLVFETTGLSKAFTSGHHDENVALAVKQTLGLDVRVTATVANSAAQPTSSPSAAPATTPPASATPPAHTTPASATPPTRTAPHPPTPDEPAYSAAPPAPVMPPPEPYDEMADLEGSVDIDQPLEFGVPVIKRILGGRVVDGDGK